MFYRTIDSDLTVGLSVPQFAEDMFYLTDRNRNFLKIWLPWLDSIQCPDDTRKYIQLQLLRFSKGEAMHQTIFYQNRIAGVIAFNHIDQSAASAEIGYWLGQEFTGKGIMTRAAKDLIHQGFRHWQLRRLEICCATDNVNSRAIPERLGFTQTGVNRNAEEIDGMPIHHIVYSLVR